MKKFILLLILCLLWTYSGSSQSIIVNDNYICFDSTAAKKLLKTTFERDNLKDENLTLTYLIQLYDSTVIDQQKIISDLEDQNKRKLEQITAIENEHKKEVKKLKRRNLITIISAGLVIVIGLVSS